MEWYCPMNPDTVTMHVVLQETSEDRVWFVTAMSLILRIVQ